MTYDNHPFHASLKNTFQELKAIKVKDRTKEQQKMYNHLMHLERKSRETAEQAEIRKFQDRQKKSELRANETPELRSTRNSKNREAMAESRNNETQEMHSARNTRDKHAKAGLRTNICPKEALNSKAIMEGQCTVKALEESVDSIGTRNFICGYCKAKKYKKRNPIYLL